MFDDERLYYTTDKELEAIGRPSTLAHWRSAGIGPRFIKLGARVAYRGHDLNEWIRSRTVETRAA